MRGIFACYALLVWFSLAQYKLFDRLFFEHAVNYEFVLASVSGVLDGHPVSKSWQQRFLAPNAVVALDRITHARLDSLKLFGGLMALCANLLLFTLMRRKGGTLSQSMAAVAGFGFLHFLLAYKLEYPWDGVDILLFLVAGYWTSQRRSIVGMVPLLLLGMFNHETVLYIPFFYLLAALDRTRFPAAIKRETLVALLLSLALGAGILYLRERFYLGAPFLPGSTIEPLTPVISNHLHVGHNLHQLLDANWKQGRAYISLAFLAVCALLLALVVRGALSAVRDLLRRRGVARTTSAASGAGAMQPVSEQTRVPFAAALWSLCVIATIVCFGYINETRHYLLLVAFWFTYALPV
jgi:hypothetical protein